jgi:hypothetical protein
MIWPPPPDIESIKELVRNADTEEFIANGSPPDEYDSEAEELFTIIAHWPTNQLTQPNLTPVIEQIWQKNFGHEQTAADNQNPTLTSLAKQIARFFGPEAAPQVRQQSTPV